jgi:outer membrane receptor for monomeric catechols
MEPVPLAMISVSIPASQIEFIEIINNPSAKYGAAGMAGIVNIVLKPQQKTGLHGEVGFSLGMGQLTRRRADLPTSMPSYAQNPQYSPSLNLNYKTGTCALRGAP